MRPFTIPLSIFSLSALSKPLSFQEHPVYEPKRNLFPRFSMRRAHPCTRRFRKKSRRKRGRKLSPCNLSVYRFTEFALLNAAASYSPEEKPRKRTTLTKPVETESPGAYFQKFTVLEYSRLSTSARSTFQF